MVAAVPEQLDLRSGSAKGGAAPFHFHRRIGPTRCARTGAAGPTAARSVPTAKAEGAHRTMLLGSHVGTAHGTHLHLSGEYGHGTRQRNRFVRVRPSSLSLSPSLRPRPCERSERAEATAKVKGSGSSLLQSLSGGCLVRFIAWQYSLTPN